MRIPDECGLDVNTRRSPGRRKLARFCLPDILIAGTESLQYCPSCNGIATNPSATLLHFSLDFGSNLVGKWQRFFFVLWIGTTVCNIHAASDDKNAGESETATPEAEPLDLDAAVVEQNLAEGVLPKIDESLQEQKFSASEDEEVKSKEDVWTEINTAISHLNQRIGSSMFRDLKRLSNTEMEVRLDASYWDRVLYQTRVSLKKDISDIWHLFVIQYNDDDKSAVFFIDDKTGKTIDIFTRSKLAGAGN